MSWWYIKQRLSNVDAYEEPPSDTPEQLRDIGTSQSWASDEDIPMAFLNLDIF